MYFVFCNWAGFFWYDMYVIHTKEEKQDSKNTKKQQKMGIYLFICDANPPPFSSYTYIKAVAKEKTVV